MKLIINKYLKGATNDLEEKKLYDWLLENNSNVQVFKEEVAFYMLNNSTTEIVDEQKAFEEFKETINKREENKQSRVFSIKKYYKYTAAIVFLLSSIYFINNSLKLKEENTNKITKDLNISNDFNHNIVLTLGDGSTKVVEKEQEELSYVNKSPEEQLIYNEIKVPKGQIFRLVLSDSTVVWLNADTKLKYPKTFIRSLKTRTILLEGEAYFEVAHNKEKPFIVNTNGVNVKVLGTKFNVSSYTNDPYINTTLVEGSVNVIDTNNTNNSLIITPSFQVSFIKENMQLSSAKVKTSDYTSWMHKRIIFNTLPFEELVSKIERTYNVEIINKNEQIKNELFTGQFDIEKIETILKALSTSFYFEYEIDKNIITIN